MPGIRRPHTPKPALNRDPPPMIRFFLWFSFTAAQKGTIRKGKHNKQKRHTHTHTPSSLPMHCPRLLVLGTLDIPERRQVGCPSSCPTKVTSHMESSSTADGPGMSGSPGAQKLICSRYQRRSRSLWEIRETLYIDTTERIFYLWRNIYIYIITYTRGAVSKAQLPPEEFGESYPK